MPGSGLGGFVEGLWGSVAATRAENYARERDQDEREAKALALLADADDDEIKAAAIAGILERANPKSKAKGLRGFFGEMEANPAIGRIQALLNTPVQKTTTTPGLPSRGIPASVGMTAIPKPPPSMGGAAMSSGSLVTGTPPPAPAGPPAPPQSAFTERRGTPEVGRVDTEMVQREPFLSREERLRRDTIAREQAEVEGEVAGYVAAGMSRPEALDLVKSNRMRRGAGYGGVREGNVHQNAAGEWVQDLYDPAGNVVAQIPALDPKQARRGGTVRYGTAVEERAKRMYNKTYAELDNVEAEAVYQQLRKENPEAAAEIAHARGRATGDEQIATKFNTPLSPDEAAQQGVAVGTTPAQMVGQTPQTTAMQDLRRNSAMLKELLPNVKETIRAALPSQQEIFGNLTPGLVMKARRLDPRYRNQIAAMESAVNLLVNNIARVVGGAKGAQSEKDAMRAEAAITNLKEGWITGDTAESAEARIDEAMAAIDAVMATLPAEIAPTATPGVAPKPGQAAQPAPNAAAPASGGVPGGGVRQPGQWFTDTRGTFIVKDPPYLPDGRLNVRRPKPGEKPPAQK